METNNHQIEELKKKIEKYRVALENLKNSKGREDSQIEKRVNSLEELFNELELQQTELFEKMKVTQSILDELQERVEKENLTEESNQMEEKEEIGFQRSNMKTIPPFKVLKQIANDLPVLYTSTHSPNQEENPFSKPRNKKNQFKALSVTDLKTSLPIEQNNGDQIDETQKYASTENFEAPIESADLVSSEPQNDPQEESLNEGNRPSGFWKGILKK
ncbi:hypothetical protein [Sporosarcina sp. SAFN-010]|uniref:hypothetical protein n=1 Tax=Sporosarcina sp. SAFN-010 TaxID=3387273 RepID=UPI003F7D8939